MAKNIEKPDGLGLPDIAILYEQKAASAVRRSAMGIVGLIVEEKDQDWTMKMLDIITDIEPADYPTSEKLIRGAFTYTPNKVVVFNKKGTLSETLRLVEREKINWVGLGYEASQEDTATLVSWIKSLRARGKTFKAVCYKAINPDEPGVVNFTNDTVTFADSRGEQPGWQYVSTILGMLAGLPMTRSATYFLAGDLVDVSMFEDVDKAARNGEFCLYKDEGKIRVCRANTSLIETDADRTKDMKYIKIIESMDMIRDDIYSTFKFDWMGKYPNDYDYQTQLMTAIEAYFTKLTTEHVLDKYYKNTAEIDVEEQRLAWLSEGVLEVGGVDIKTMDDEDMKRLTFDTIVFLAGDIKILNTIEDFQFKINMV